MLKLKNAAHARRVLRHLVEARERAKYLTGKPDAEELSLQLQRAFELAEAMAEEPDPAPQGFTEEELDEFFDQETRSKRQ